MLFQEFSLVAGRIVKGLSREAELEEAITHTQTKLTGLLKNTKSHYSNAFTSVLSAGSPRHGDQVYKATQEIHAHKIQRRAGETCKMLNRYGVCTRPDCEPDS